MDITVQKVILPVFVAVAVTSATFIARGIAFSILHKWDQKTAARIGEIIDKSVRVPSLYWCVAVGLYVGIVVSEMPEKYASYFDKAIHVMLILSFTAAVANLAGKIFRNYIQKSDLPLPTTGLAYGILKGTIYVAGILIMLGVLGISIAPLITALGVGGLAVALALQDTLANLFAGIHILVEKSIRVGDYIRLESGQEGRVEDITWRTTRIKMMPNNMVIIPNKNLSQSVVINYSLPGKMMMLIMPIGVGYDSDPETIETILMEEVDKAKGEIVGLLPDSQPSVRLVGFGESSLDFTLSCQIEEYSYQQAVQHELRKRIFRRFKEKGIEIPFTQRTVFIRSEKSEAGDLT
ncbi:MAG: mechanosensitive ion channel family protein [Dissulfurispiraceae bacterium]